MVDSFTVTQVNSVVKHLIDLQIGFIRVEGEISHVTVSLRGHVYITLQEEKSILKAVLWSGNNISFNPERGMFVGCFGKLTAYQSGYQLVIENMLLAGLGNLEAILREKKERLAKEGLFDAEHKRTLPMLPKIIGVITSTKGAVIHDIIACISSRLGCKLIIWPVAVQGELALQQIYTAIHGFNAIKANPPQVLIIARGGGSMEDLWVFNEEKLVRAVFDSKIPIVSAIGHETDVTLIDYVADYRSPTPSLAAEHVMPKKSDLLAILNVYKSRYRCCWEKLSMICKNRLANLRIVSPVIELEKLQNRLEQVQIRLKFGFSNALSYCITRLKLQAKFFDLMETRYAMFYDVKSRCLIKNHNKLHIGDEILAFSFKSGSTLRLKLVSIGI